MTIIVIIMKSEIKYWNINNENDINNNEKKWQY